MFSTNAIDNTKMVDISFIAGVKYDDIKKYNFSQNVIIKPEILMSFPENKDLINSSIVDFVFPSGIDVGYVEDKPKFYCITLTNEKGNRSYIYILRLLERINITELNVEITLFSNTNSSNTTRNHSVLEDYKYFYVPYAICLWSTVSNIEFFQKVMIEICKPIKYFNNNFSEETIRSYRYSELLHIFIFLSNIIKPPSYTKLNINFHNSIIDLYTPSRYEIPNQDYNIKILFNCLDTSVIIKLWYSVLTEKHIIIIANQNHLLFSICEAIVTLMFPFKWLHAYIPVLPKNQSEYLESPTPYIMGVLSSYFDFQYLKETFPNHIICDVNTSMIYGSPYCSLPVNEEIKLRKKLQYIKHPEIYEIEDINEIGILPNKVDYCLEDINVKRKFSENAQHIFFALTKKVLIDVKKKYIVDGVFESEKFLGDISDEELRNFWEKIINTVSFEYFILSFQYLDDSNTKIFKNMCKKSFDEEKFLSKIGMYEFTMNLPTSMNLFSDLEYKAGLLENIKNKSMKTYIDKLKDYSTSYNQILSELNINYNMTHTNSLKKFNNKLNKDEIIRAKRNNLSYDFSMKKGLDTSIENIFNSNKLSIHNYTNSKCNNSASHFESFNERKNDLFRIHGKKGFINYVEELFSILNKKEVFEIGYQQDIVTEINKCYNKKFSNVKKIVNNNKILELESDDELNSSLEISSYRINIEKGKTNIIDLPKIDTFQYYLVQAYYLSEYNDNKDIIFNLFNRAGELDKNSFPCIRFLQFLEDFNDLKKIRFFLSSSSNKIVSKILTNKIRSKAKSKTVNINDIKLKTNIEYDDEDEDEDVMKNKPNRKNSRKVLLNKEDNNDYMKRLSSFRLERISIIDGLENLTDAEKLVENMKSSEDKIVKVNIINNYIKIYKTERDPLGLAEVIAVQMFSLILKTSLNKFKPEMISHKLFIEINNLNEFKKIKEWVAELQKVNLMKLKNDRLKTCFWLNILNFLVIFTIILKKEVLNSYYEWYRFLKNSYFNIGGYEVSLYEIENCILTNNSASQNIYGEIPVFKDDDKRKVLKIEKIEKYSNYGIALPTKSSPGLRIYFPSNLSELLKLNVIEYFTKNVNIDLEKNNLNVSEYITWVDGQLEDIHKYKELLSEEYINFIDSVENLTKIIIKYDWSISFSNISNIN